jgi:hypothetical protein
MGAHVVVAPAQPSQLRLGQFRVGQFFLFEVIHGVLF